MLRALLGALVLLCVLPASVVAQTPTRIIVNQPYTVEATHDGLNTQWFTLRDAGAVIVTVPVSALSNGVVAFPGVTFTLGAHAIDICAANDTVGNTGASCSPVLNVAAVHPPPSAPGTPTITLTTKTALRIGPSGQPEIVSHEASISETPTPQP